MFRLWKYEYKLRFCYGIIGNFLDGEDSVEFMLQNVFIFKKFILIYFGVKCYYTFNIFFSVLGNNKYVCVLSKGGSGGCCKYMCVWRVIE